MRRTGKARGFKGVAVVAGLLLAMVACTGGGGESAPESKAPIRIKPADAVPEAWTAPLLGGRVPALTESVAGLVLLTDSKVVVAHASDTGKEMWRLQLPPGAEPCGLPGAADNGTGLGVVLFKSAGRSCAQGGVVDMRTGALVWQHDFTREMAYDGNVEMSIGTAVATVVLPCGTVRRFDARTGAELPGLLTADTACAHQVAHDGRYVVVVNSPDEGVPVPAFAPPDYDGKAEFALYDAETGAKLWGRTVDAGDGWQLHGIASSDPLAIDVTIDRDRKVRVFDGQGQEVRSLDEKPEASALARSAEGRTWLPLGRPPASGIPAYDLATGTRLPGVPAQPGVAVPGTSAGAAVEETVVGFDGRRVVTVLTKPAPPGEHATAAEMRVVAYDVHTGQRSDLGRIDRLQPEPAGGTTMYAVVHPLMGDGRHVYITRWHLNAPAELVALSLPA